MLYINKLHQTHQTTHMAVTNVTNLPFFATIKKVMDNNKIVYTFDKMMRLKQEFRSDMLYIQNVIEGNIISNKMYPIIYRTTNPDDINYGRSIGFLNEFAKNKTLLSTLTYEQVKRLKVGLRDIVQCVSESNQYLLTFQITMETINGCIKNLNTDESELLNVGKYIVSSTPSIDNCIKYNFVLNDIESNESLLECYGSPYCIGFVAPEDVSYANFENIIHIDEYFNGDANGFNLLINDTIMTNEANNYVQLFDDCMMFKTKTNLAIHLLEMNNFGLYTVPINKNSRGGLRFIFNSPTLAQMFEIIVRQHLSPDLLTNFVKVNNVFRYNKFDPGEHKFESHMDTPYYDKMNKHYSKYTMILYLTSGTNTDSGIVKFKNIHDETYDKTRVVREIYNDENEMTAIIFDQKYEHEGNPYIDTTKIFIRTELIYSYTDDVMSYDSYAAKMFNIACYASKLNILHEEVMKYSSECFNRVNKMRLGYDVPVFEEYLYLKESENGEFITNGHDYWMKGNESCIDNMIRAVILDYFYGGCVSVTPRIIKVCNNILRLNKINVYDMLTKPFNKNHITKVVGSREYTPNDDMCCPYHMDDFDPTQCADVINEYHTLTMHANDSNMTKLIIDTDCYTMSLDRSGRDGVTFYERNKYETIDESGTKHVTCEIVVGGFETFNYAACWNCTSNEKSYITTTTKTCDTVVGALIKVDYVGNNFHFVVDAFNNNFIHSTQVKTYEITENANSDIDDSDKDDDDNDQSDDDDDSDKDDDSDSDTDSDTDSD